MLAAGLSLAVIAAWVVLPKQDVHWEPPASDVPHAGDIDSVLVIHRRSGFRWRGRGLSMNFTAHVPKLRATTPLSRAVFERLRDDCYATGRQSDIRSVREMVNAMEYKGVATEFYESLRYEVHAVSPRFISVYKNDFQYTVGKYGDLTIRGRNFIWTGDHLVEMNLDDLFIPGRPWFDALLADVKADLARQKAPFAVPAFSPVWFYVFTISEEGLRIHFRNPESHINPSVYVVIEPWERLRPYLRSSSPVTQWVADHKDWQGFADQ